MPPLQVAKRDTVGCLSPAQLRQQQHGGLRRARLQRRVHRLELRLVHRGRLGPGLLQGLQLAFDGLVLFLLIFKIFSPKYAHLSLRRFRQHILVGSIFLLHIRKCALPREDLVKDTPRNDGSQ